MLFGKIYIAFEATIVIFGQCILNVMCQEIQQTVY